MVDLEKAKRFLPGGVNSPVRAFRAVGGEPFFVVKGLGAWVFDSEGRRYVDYICSWGALILGHSDPRVLSVLKDQLERGTSYGLLNPWEVELAEKLVDHVPSLEMVRLLSSGTEATMTAIRLSRAFTGRKRVIKFEGCYHGHSDGLLVQAGSGALTFGVPSSQGVPEEYASLTLVAPYNDLDSVERLFKAYSGEIASVIVEPVCGNMGVVLPREGFLQGLRDLCDKNGALLIFDEVITGFRLSLSGAQGLYGVRPDLTCLGKIIGGGLPVGAVGGRREIMSLLAPEGPVYQAGTLAGNPLAVRAGLETIRILEMENPYEELEKKTKALAQGILEAFGEKGIPVRLNQIGSMLSVFFTEGEVFDLDSAKRSDTALFSAFFHGLLKRGILIPPSQFEAWFVSTAHTEEHFSLTLEAIRETLKEL
jgi:glutamate-1-semialdehyde 2,1-aminomutase